MPVTTKMSMIRNPVDVDIFFYSFFSLTPLCLDLDFVRENTM